VFVREKCIVIITVFGDMEALGDMKNMFKGMNPDALGDMKNMFKGMNPGALKNIAGNAFTGKSEKVNSRDPYLKICNEIKANSKQIQEALTNKLGSAQFNQSEFFNEQYKSIADKLSDEIIRKINSIFDNDNIRIVVLLAAKKMYEGNEMGNIFQQSNKNKYFELLKQQIEQTIGSVREQAGGAGDEDGNMLDGLDMSQLQSLIANNQGSSNMGDLAKQLQKRVGPQGSRFLQSVSDSSLQRNMGDLAKQLQKRVGPQGSRFLQSVSDSSLQRNMGNLTDTLGQALSGLSNGQTGNAIEKIQNAIPGASKLFKSASKIANSASTNSSVTPENTLTATFDKIFGDGKFQDAVGNIILKRIEQLVIEQKIVDTILSKQIEEVANAYQAQFSKLTEVLSGDSLACLFIIQTLSKDLLKNYTSEGKGTTIGDYLEKMVLSKKELSTRSGGTKRRRNKRRTQKKRHNKNKNSK
jgi:hypothetical protein